MIKFTTLESICQGINVGPGKFDKKNEHMFIRVFPGIYDLVQHAV